MPSSHAHQWHDLKRKIVYLLITYRFIGCHPQISNSLLSVEKPEVTLLWQLSLLRASDTTSLHLTFCSVPFTKHSHRRKHPSFFPGSPPVRAWTPVICQPFSWALVSSRRSGPETEPCRTSQEVGSRHTVSSRLHSLPSEPYKGAELLRKNTCFLVLCLQSKTLCNV